MTKTAQPAHTATADITGEQRPEPVPPEPHRLVADINAAFE